MAKYTLVGVDGNAFSIMGYTSRALKNEGLRDLVDQMHNEAMSGDYDNLISVCMKYVDMANDAAADNGYVDDDYDEIHLGNKPPKSMYNKRLKIRMRNEEDY